MNRKSLLRCDAFRNDENHEKKKAEGEEEERQSRMRREIVQKINIKTDTFRLTIAVNSYGK